MRRPPFGARTKPFTPPPACKCNGRVALKLKQNIRTVLGPHVSGSLIMPPQDRWAYVCPVCSGIIAWADDHRTRMVIDFLRPLGTKPIYDKETPR